MLFDGYYGSALGSSVSPSFPWKLPGVIVAMETVGCLCCQEDDWVCSLLWEQLRMLGDFVPNYHIDRKFE